MSDLECAPLTPFDAMASSCLVVGFHGNGGLEYPSDANGVWLRPDPLKETADPPAEPLRGVEQVNPGIDALRRAGQATAADLNPDRTAKHRKSPIVAESPPVRLRLRADH